MSKKTPTPHDSLFKAFMTTPETAKDFLEIHLPKSLRDECDLTTLQLLSSSFIEDSLRPYISDVLYSMKTKQGKGYIYALVEHQSSADPHMAFRMMRYSIAAMQQHLDEKNKKLPLVIPILFYHGRETPYPYSINWLDGFDNPTLAKSLYSQDFPLVDITVIADDEIMQHQRVALLELVQKHIRTRDVQEIIEHLATLLLKGYTTDKQVRSLMEYILQVGETGNFKTLITTLATQVPEHEETLMTIAEQLRQEGESKGLLRGRQEGRQDGEQIGREKAQLDMAKKMLSSGANSSYILEITGLTAEQLIKLVN